MQDLYETLGVARGADDAAIKSAYRKLAMKYHPDRNPNDAEAEAKFKEVSAAYEVLKDQDKRAAYDTHGHAAFENGGMGGAGGFGAGGMGGFTDIFEQMFGMGRGAAHAEPQRGNDVRVNLRISLEDAYNGLEKDIKIPIKVACKTCNGHGTKDGEKPASCGQCHGQGKIRMQQGPFSIEQTCPACRGRGHIITNLCGTCRGSGLVSENKTIKAQIPAGIDDGQRIRLTGQGEAGPNGAPPGDLYLFIQISDHRLYERDGAHLHCEIPISMIDASLGTTLEIPMPTGKRVQVTIPEGTQTGTRLRLRGKGMPIMRREQFGDMFVHTRVETPVNLTKRQRELLEEFRGEEKGNSNSPESNSFIERLKGLWDNFTDD